jgi:biopolymer transport protein ExbD
MVNFDKKRQKAPYESVVPLINVVFLLLIFFLLAGTLKPSEPINVVVPQGEIDEVDPSDPLTIFVDEDGLVYIRDNILGPEVVATYIAAIFAEERRPEILIKADAKAPAQDVVTVLENLREIGVESVRVITQAVEHPDKAGASQ